MMDMMYPPDLPAFSSRAATGIWRCSPCAGAAFFVWASQVITKPGAGAQRRAAFLPLQNSNQAVACVWFYLNLGMEGGRGG